MSYSISLDERRFQQVPNKLINDLRNKKLEPIDIAVFIVLLNHAHGKGVCYPGIKRIGDTIGCSERTVSRSLKRLEAAKHVKRGPKNPNSKTTHTILLSKVVNNTVKLAAPHKGDIPGRAEAENLSIGSEAADDWPEEDAAGCSEVDTADF